MKNRASYKKPLLALPLFALALFAHSLEWPLARAEVLSLFGQKREGGVESGIVIEGDTTIRSAGDGIVLAVISKNRNMTGFPSTLGNALVLAHSDGIVSVYGNLEDTSMLEGRERLETNAVIARTGQSAWQGRQDESQEGRLRGICIFQLMDQRQNALLNPLLLLTPMADTAFPTIGRVILESQAGRMYNLDAEQSLAGGSYKVYVLATDSYQRNAGQGLSPFRVSVIVNGMEASVVSFETMAKKRNIIVPNSTPEHLDGSVPLYAAGGELYAGNISLSRGMVELIVAARDFAGNERTSSFMLRVN